ncbi:unnamed protein product [Calypogeia fissa]
MHVYGILSFHKTGRNRNEEEETEGPEYGPDPPVEEGRKEDRVGIIAGGIAGEGLRWSLQMVNEAHRKGRAYER